MTSKKQPTLTLVPDTSVISDGRLSEEVRQGALDGATLVIPEAVLAELEFQSGRGQEIGFTGLKELKALQALAQEHELALRYAGERPQPGEAGAVDGGVVDGLVVQLAEGEGATLMTSNRIQATVAQAKGLPLRYVGSGEGDEDLDQLRLMRLFDEHTMSVHLRVGTPPRAKRGTPGAMEICQLDEAPSTERELERIAHEIVERAEVHPDGFIEMDSGGATVVQLVDFRIVIAHPPFADALEITAVRPVARTTLDHYTHAELLKKRLHERYRGVLVSGAPGAGKSTFVQAMVDALETKGWIVKTMEKPRDLQVSSAVTQYTALDGDMANTANVLLLVRPDYTVFDEMRQTDDFQVFADMRLAGVGLVGVVHATRGIDSLQRLIGRVELGMIPQVVDTVVFIENGDVAEVFEIGFTVKPPTGMGDSDLARPVIEVREFDTKELKYEIYTFGDQIVVMPLEEGMGPTVKPVWRLAEQALTRELSRAIKAPVQVEITGESRATLYVDEHLKPQVIGRGGRRISELEARFAMRFDVRAFGENRDEAGQPAQVQVTHRHVILDVPTALRGQTVEVEVDGESAFIGSVSKSGSIKLVQGSEAAKLVLDGQRAGAPILARRVR